MRRNFLTALLVCLAPTILAGVYVARGFYRESDGEVGFRRGIDLAGGTILVYEVNLDAERSRTDENGRPVDASEGLSSDEIKKLAENLKQRIDPNDLKNVIVRPLGSTRIEIILPFTGTSGGSKEAATEDFVQEVKGLVRQVGVLEFRIAANMQDDSEGIEAAKKELEAAETDPKVKERLDAAAKAGLPPPPPEGTFTVMDRDDVRYEWVELGESEMETLFIEKDQKNKIVYLDGVPQINQLAQMIKAEPGKVHIHSFPAGKEHTGKTVSIALYRRPFIKVAKTETESQKKAEYFMLTRVSPVDAMRVEREIGLNARSETDTTGDPIVQFSFNSTGAQRFGTMTERNRPTQTYLRTLAVVMDKKIVSAPYLGAVLREGGVISGNFTRKSVNELVYILRSGALNAELKPDPVSENTVGPTLGQDTIRRGLLAVGYSFGAVLIFMMIYYRFSGIVACIALLANLLLTVGVMVAVNAAFTLPGLAGIVLMLGMAVDANVLIYERIREEREKGANLPTAIRLGYDRAFATIIDTHLTSIFTCLILYAAGNDNLKGFAVSLTLGLIISLFTALYMTRVVFDYAVVHKWISHLRMMRLFARPNFNFMKLRHVMFTFTAVMTLAGMLLFLYRGESVLNVDFTKGTAYGGRLKEGQARALNTTPDGKLGMLDLLSDVRQEERLQVKEVVPLGNSESADQSQQRAFNENIWRIIYSNPDGSTSDTVVTLANKPDGATIEEEKANLTARASLLPSLSVEQVFITPPGESFAETFDNGKSRSFTLRTTEKEPELVQAMLDRLLRDEKTNEQLLSTTHITDIQFNGTTAELTLDKPASPSYLEGFIERELKLGNRVPIVGTAPAVQVTGVASADEAAAQLEGRTGQFAKLLVDVSQNPEFAALNTQQTYTTRMGTVLGASSSGALILNSGALSDERDFQNAVQQAKAAFESQPMPDRLETFDPSLAKDTRNRALLAIAMSWLAIMVYLWFRFGNWTFGLAAVLCLVHDLCFTLGAIALCHYVYNNPFGQLLLLHDFKIDLTAVAALLTLIGYSVNDTIVVFDRIREIRGKNPALTEKMINDSVNGTLSRTVLASVTVFLVVGVLYLFGGEGVHLFSFVMVVGVIVGTYSSIYVASPLLLFFGEGKEKTNTRTTGAKPAAVEV